MKRILPKWNDTMSDGCSHVTQLARPCCVGHDRAYYLGGSKADRIKADQAFYVCMVRSGVPSWRARIRYYGVRYFGGPEWREKGVSWSFGGQCFKYTDCPAEETKS